MGHFRKKKWKGNFWFCFAATDYKMSYLYFITYRSILSLISPSLRRDEALPLRVWWWLETLWLRPRTVVTQRMWIVPGTNYSHCACPTRPMRAQIPAVFRKNYKTAGIAPLPLNHFLVMLHHEVMIEIIIGNVFINIRGLFWGLVI